MLVCIVQHATSAVLRWCSGWRTMVVHRQNDVVCTLQPCQCDPLTPQGVSGCLFWVASTACPFLVYGG